MQRQTWLWVFTLLGLARQASAFHLIDPHQLALSASVFSSSPSSILPNLFHQYQNSLHTDPLLTQMTTGVVLAVLGDGIAQSTSDAPYNKARAASFASFDGVYRAAQHFIYPPMIAACQGHTLEGILPSYLPAAAVEQALASQLVVIPLVYYPSFFAVTGMVQGLSVQETVERAKETFLPLMARNLMFWIPVQYGVFAYCKSEDLQISILIACGLIWTIILSALAGSANTQKPQLVTSEPYQPEQAMQQLIDSERIYLDSNNGELVGATTAEPTRSKR